MSGPSVSPSAGDSTRPRRVPVGWLVGIAILAASVAITARMFYLIHTRTTHAIGDGVTVESYRFDLSTLLVSRETFVASGLPKDGLRSLDNLSGMTAQAADAYNREHRSRYLVPDDRVIGVALEGRARAYPLRVLTWHEVANDIVGGRPIAVTYSPLCDSAVVFDRTAGGEVLEFGFSGLLYDSNLILYDRRAGGSGESLWSQLEFRAIAGPAAREGKTLAPIPCVVARWEDWRRLHPQTDVVAPDPLMMNQYKKDPYVNYFGAPEQLRFPVEPLPPKGAGLEWKTPVVVVEAGGERRVVPLPVVARGVDASGVWTTALGGEALRFEYHEQPPTVLVTSAADGRPAAIAYAFWSAWYSTHPEARVVDGPAGVP